MKRMEGSSVENERDLSTLGPKREQTVVRDPVQVRILVKWGVVCEFL